MATTMPVVTIGRRKQTFLRRRPELGEKAALDLMSERKFSSQGVLKARFPLYTACSLNATIGSALGNRRMPGSRHPVFVEPDAGATFSSATCRPRRSLPRYVPQLLTVARTAGIDPRRRTHGQPYPAALPSRLARLPVWRSNVRTS